MSERLTLLFLIICIFSFKVRADSDQLHQGSEDTIHRTTISIHLTGKSRFIFNYKNNYGTYVTFKNFSTNDTIVKKYFIIRKPTLFYYIIDPTTNNFRSLLVLPGDSIVLSNNAEKVNYSTSYPDYIENMINIPPLFYQYNPLLIKQFNINGAGFSLDFIETNFEKNQKKIHNTQLNNNLKCILDHLNQLIRFQLISCVDQTTVTASEFTVLDSLNKDMIKDMVMIGSINTSVEEGICKYLIQSSYYNKNKKPITDFWTEVNEVSEHVSSSSYYYSYLLALTQTYFVYDFQELGRVNKKLKKISNPNSAIKAVMLLSDILLKTTSDFNQAKMELRNFENGKYMYLFENENKANHETRNLIQIKATTLIDNKRSSKSFKTLFQDDVSLYVIDFWASWCPPCISDYPYLKRVQDQLKQQPVKFISISLDEKVAFVNWVKALKKLGAYNQPNQFILENAKESPLKHFFRISSIPRYVVIDGNGNILSEEFFRPSDPRFKVELLKLLHIL